MSTKEQTRPVSEWSALELAEDNVVACIEEVIADAHALLTHIKVRDDHWQQYLRNDLRWLEDDVIPRLREAVDEWAELVGE